MSEPASISGGIAARYATAIFELARDDNALDALESDIASLSAALAESEDFRKMIASPIVSRREQGGAISAIAKAMKLGATLSNALALMAERRRLFVLPQLLRALRERIAAEKGEITADVTSAAPLSAAQAAKLAEVLTSRTGRTVRLNSAVDPGLIGGLIVKVGSKMIDTSIRSRLAGLQNAMKEVG